MTIVPVYTSGENMSSFNEFLCREEHPRVEDCLLPGSGRDDSGGVNPSS